jgi:hypothetical protein
VTPRNAVVGYQSVGVPCCLHLQVVRSCNIVVGHRRFEGPCCLHLQVVTSCNIVVGHQRFGGPCCLYLQVATPHSVMVGYRRFGGPCCLCLQVVMLCSDVVGYQCWYPTTSLHRVETPNRIYAIIVSFSWPLLPSVDRCQGGKNYGLRAPWKENSHVTSWRPPRRDITAGCFNTCKLN